MNERERKLKRLRRLRWRKLHPDEWRAEKRRYYQTRRLRDGKPYRPRVRHTIGRDTKDRYGITQEEFDELFEAQNGRCAICESSLHRPGEGSYAGKSCIDHCHKTNVVRGILCTSCNT